MDDPLAQHDDPHGHQTPPVEPKPSEPRGTAEDPDYRVWPGDGCDVTPDGKKRCKAISKRAKAEGHRWWRCRRFVTPGRDVCHYHGGRTPRGIGLPQFKHGGYSKDLPPNLREVYQRAAEDEDLTSLQEELKLLTVRLKEMCRRLDTVDSVNWRPQLKEQAARLKRAHAASPPDLQAAREALTELLRLVDAGAVYDQVWEDLQDVLERKSRVAAREWKRQADLSQLITAEDSIKVVMAIMRSVADNVPDPRARAAIARDLQLALDREEGRQPLMIEGSARDEPAEDVG